MQKSLYFRYLLHSFLKFFSNIMSYDCPMLFCIKVSLFEPISIRYTLKSLIRMAKQQNLEKIKPQFLKIF